jgi:hypothetical protein
MNKNFGYFPSSQGKKDIGEWVCNGLHLEQEKGNKYYVVPVRKPRLFLRNLLLSVCQLPIWQIRPSTVVGF